MRAQFTAAIAILTLAGSVLHAQSPAPIVVQAITPESANPPRVVSAPTAANADATLKLLQEIKAANAEVLSKQAATLQQLDDLEKAADQIKIFSKRG
jgi:hypothetical protein